jgi:tRNA threonylcarbamoyladenosine biosynthesis protein TsaB
VSYILHVETSTKNCSVSIGKSGVLVALEELNTEGYSHAEKLHVFLKDVVEKAGISFADVSAICVGKGPGSYTGLRIGVSAVKGLCFALDIPMLAIESLEILSRKAVVTDGYILPLLDARRMEVYSAVFDKDYKRVRETQAEVIDENSFQEYLERGPVFFIGDGAEKCKDIVQHPNAHFIENAFPSAKEMVSLAFEKYTANDTVDVAYFEPFYLKDFVGTKPKKRN